MHDSKMRDADLKNPKTRFSHQILKVILTHLEAAGIACIFQTVAFWYFIAKFGFKEILGVLFTLIYMGFIYHIVRKFTKRDLNRQRSLINSSEVNSEDKIYKPKCNIAKGVALGAILSVITVLLFIAWKAAWLYSSDGESLVGIPATICNLVFVYWTFPFFGLMGASHGYVTFIGMICMILSPTIASTVGCLAAKYNVDIADIIQGFVYEKPDSGK